MRGSASVCGSARRTPAAEKQGTRGGSMIRLVTALFGVALATGVLAQEPTFDLGRDSQLAQRGSDR